MKELEKIFEKLEGVFDVTVEKSRVENYAIYDDYKITIKYVDSSIRVLFDTFTEKFYFYEKSLPHTIYLATNEVGVDIINTLTEFYNIIMENKKERDEKELEKRLELYKEQVKQMNILFEESQYVHSINGVDENERWSDAYEALSDINIKIKELENE